MVLPLRRRGAAPHNLPEREGLWLTLHAEERMAERGVSAEAIKIVVVHGDINLAAKGCDRRRLSRGMAKRLDSNREYARASIEEARSVAVVTDPEGSVVTVVKRAPDLRFRRLGARPTRPRAWRKQEDAE